MPEKGRPSKPNADRPKGTPGKPTCPKFLDKNGRSEWKRIVSELDVMGMLSRSDRAAIATLADTWSDFVYSVSKYSEEKNSTNLNDKNKLRDRIIKYSGQLGLTPISREKIELREVQSISEFENFINPKVIHGGKKK